MKKKWKHIKVQLRVIEVVLKRFENFWLSTSGSTKRAEKDKC